MGEERVFVDVTVVHPTSQSRIELLGVPRNRAVPRVNDGTYALDMVAARKRAKYAGIERSGARFMVAAITTYGSMHSEFLRLLKLIATAGTGGAVPDGLRWSLDRIVGAVSAALVRGNDAVVQGALQLAAGGPTHMRRLVPRQPWQAGVARAGDDERRERAAAALALVGGGQIAALAANTSRVRIARRAGDANGEASAAIDVAAAEVGEEPSPMPTTPRGRGRGRGGRGRARVASSATRGGRGTRGRRAANSSSSSSTE